MDGLAVGNGDGAGDGGRVGAKDGLPDVVGVAVGGADGLAVGAEVGAAVGQTSQATGHSSDTVVPLTSTPHQSAIRSDVLVGFVVIHAQVLVVVAPLYS